MCDLTGRTALVTGGAQGVGRGIATELVQAGACVVIASRSSRNGSSIKLDLPGYTALAVQVDVTDMESVRRCVDEAIKWVGHIDILVNSAGVFQSRLGFELEDSDFNRCLDINLTGMWRLTQVLVPHFKARGGGKIINIASIGGRRGNRYCGRLLCLESSSDQPSSGTRS